MLSIIFKLVTNVSGSLFGSSILNSNIRSASKTCSIKVIVEVYNFASGCEDDEPCDTYEYNISLTNAPLNDTITVISNDEPTVVTSEFKTGIIQEGEKFTVCAEVNTGGEIFKNCETGVNGSGTGPEVIQIYLGK